MRHNRTINHLGRKSGHRKSMLANMACSLILHKRIETTVAKAKALREYVEPLITKSLYPLPPYSLRLPQAEGGRYRAFPQCGSQDR